MKYYTATIHTDRTVRVPSLGKSQLFTLQIRAKTQAHAAQRFFHTFSRRKPSIKFVTSKFKESKQF